MADINERLALRALQAIWHGDEDRVAQQIIHADYHNHEAAADRPGGPEGFKETARRLREAFDELRIEPLDVIASRDKVTVRVTFSGRHVGPFAGMPITGRAFSVQHIHIFRILDGKLVEHWANRDDAGMMRQLGLLPIGATGATVA
ncbi:MAG: ester cyclase [Actinobacteria bacterium]|nr:ester cyclase [Actinomycetota bacterium]